MLPIDHTVLVNRRHAPGALINHGTDGRLPCVCQPPRDAAMPERELERARSPLGYEVYPSLARLVGIGESAAAEKLQDLTDQQTNPTS